MNLSTMPPSASMQPVTRPKWWFRNVGGLLGAERLGARGEADDVGEQHGHLAVLGRQRGRDRRG